MSDLSVGEQVGGLSAPTLERQGGAESRGRSHELKVVPPYFDALADGTKTFEVRRNDRAFQAGDVLVLREYGTHAAGLECPPCDHRTGRPCGGCHKRDTEPHFGQRQIARRVSFVYSGDPRFGGIEPGHVVLGLAMDVSR